MKCKLAKLEGSCRHLLVYFSLNIQGKKKSHSRRVKITTTIKGINPNIFLPKISPDLVLFSCTTKTLSPTNWSSNIVIIIKLKHVSTHSTKYNSNITRQNNAQKIMLIKFNMQQVKTSSSAKESKFNSIILRGTTHWIHLHQTFKKENCPKDPKLQQSCWYQIPFYLTTNLKSILLGIFNSIALYALHYEKNKVQISTPLLL